MKRTTLLLSTVAALALVTPAQAGNMKGWYFSLEGGVTGANNLNYDVIGTPTITHTHVLDADVETGWALFGSIGYGLTERWRVEIEGGYRSNDIDNLFEESPTYSSGVTYVTRDVDGDLREFSLMANVMYDAPISEKMSLTVGGGIGADHVDFDDGYYGSDESWNFAYQGIIGLNYDIGAQSQLFVRYRYFVVPDPELSFESVTVPGHFCCQNFDDIEKHTGTIGFRYFFAGAPVVVPPTPTPTPTPPVTKQFIVFFGYNKCNITAEADRVLSEAAATAKATGSGSVIIVGHTDTSGSAAYNQRLSDCRANAPNYHLVDKGIGAGQISASGRGEAELMVQTADGVKEPQNRRATIDVE